MTKTVTEPAPEEEIGDHPGYDKHAVEERNRTNTVTAPGRSRLLVEG